MFRFLSLFFLASNALATPNIVVSIMPIHSLVSGITQGITTPKLLLSSNQSAHHTHLLPSQLKKLGRADLMVMMHPDFEQGLAKILRQIEPQKIITVNANIANHHSWLDVDKMRDFVQKLTQKLSILDAQNQQKYQQNYAKLNQQLITLKRTIQRTLSKQNQPIMAYSNAFDYFTQANNLKKIAHINSQHEQRLSLYKMLNAKKFIKNNQIHCLLSTLEVPKKRIDTLTQGLDVNSQRIDIIGNNLDSGAGQYFQLMLNITKQVGQCLQ
jgi:zinc transport system substrate-binding protein